MRKKALLLIVCLLFLVGCNAEENVELSLEANVEPEVVEKEEVVEVEEKEVFELNTAMNVEPLETNEYGVKLESPLALTFKSDVTLEEVTTNVKFIPERAFEVEKTDNRNYTVIPEEKWEKNTIYTMTYDPLDYTKAFQTMEYLAIVDFYPNTDYTSVHTNAVVELHFNSENITSIDEYFSIEPEVLGTFEYHKEKIVFIPQQLEEETTYTVKVASGVSDGVRTLQESFSFKFETRSNYSYEKSVHAQIVNVKPNEPFSVGLSRYTVEDSYDVKIFQVTDFDLYRDSYLKLKKQNVDDVKFDDMHVVFEEKIESTTYGYENLLGLPPLEDGYFIAELNDKHRYIFIQVNNYQVYTSRFENGSMYWLVDSDINEPVANADIYMNEELKGATGEDGVLFIDETTLETDMYASVGGDSILMSLKPNEYDYYYDYYYDEYSNSQTKYWGFIYTDRHVYQTKDKVNIFAFLRNRSDEPIESLTMKIGRNWSEEYFVEKEVYLDEHLTLTEGFDFELETGYYTVNLYDGEKRLAYSEFYVDEYEKPEIELESSIDELLIMHDDTFNYTFNASYFSGLAYRDKEFEITHSHKYDDQVSENMFTDENGNIEKTITPRVTSTNWRPVNYYVYASNKGESSQYLNTRTYLSVMPHDIMITSKHATEDNTANVDVMMNYIDISDYSGSFGMNYEDIKGESYDGVVTVRIEDNYVLKTFVETVYNPLHKVSFDIYEYEYVTEQLDSQQVTTYEGLGNFTFEMQDNHSYSIELEVKSPDGKSVIESFSIYNYKYKRNQSEHTDRAKPYHYNYNYSVRYDVGETVVFQLLDSGSEPVAENDNDLSLNLILREGLQSYEVTDSARYEFEFTKAHRPNVMYKSIYFDGNMMHMTPKENSFAVNFDYETLECSIFAYTDKGDYNPAETVTLNVEVQDKDGQPFNGALNVSVVDEAYFELYYDYFNMGRTLHRYVYNDGILNEEVSSVAYDPFASGAECGEGGDGDYIRDDLPDTATFETINVVDGKATYTFKLPDNLTRWRVTMHVVNKELYYGVGKTNITTSLPFFVRGLYNKEYIKGDDVFITASCDGSETTETSEVLYNSKFEGKDDVLSQSKSIGRENTHLSIGLVEEGTYDVTLVGQMDDYQDGLKESIEVVESFIDFSHRREGDLNNDFVLSNPSRETDLYVYNKDAREYLYDLYDIINYSQERVEEIIARHYARQLINDNFYELNLEELSLSGYQYGNEGIRPLTTANPSIETTSLIAGTGYGMEAFNRSYVIGYLKSILTNYSTTATSKGMALWGLAAQDEKVLLVINEFLEAEPFDELTDGERIYVVLALLDIGDVTRAYNYGVQFLNEYDDNNLSTQEKLLVGTLANRLGIKENLYNELLEVDDIREESLGLHKLYYLSTKPMTFKDANMTYSLNGVRETVELSDASSVHIEISEDDTFKLDSVDDNLAFTEIFKITGLNAEEFKSSALKINKVYENSNPVIGDIVEVIIEVRNPTKKYVQIRDVIPAGFEFAGQSEDSNFHVYHDGRNISKSYYSNMSNVTIKYYIRAVQVGRYKSEPATVQMYFDGELESTITRFLEVISD